MAQKKMRVKDRMGLMVVVVLLLAGGSSRRFADGAGVPSAPDGEATNKVYLPLGVGGSGACSLRRGLDGLVGGLLVAEKGAMPKVKRLAIQPVIRRGDEAHLKEALNGFNYTGVAVLPAVLGGATRGDSVRAGLANLEERLEQAFAEDSRESIECEEIWAHDAARPQVSASLIGRIRKAFYENDDTRGDKKIAGVFPALAQHEALRRLDKELSAATPYLVESLNRTRVVASQTPQVFRLTALRHAHEMTQKQNLPPETADDDAGLVAATGGRLVAVQGVPENIKLTTRQDFERVSQNPVASLAGLRCGAGFDIHALKKRTPADPPLKLGGIEIESDLSLVAHSDGDVVLHALCDAIFSALGVPDLGAQFPDSAPQWKNADSAVFVKQARTTLLAHGGRLCNVSLVVIAEQPKIAPYRLPMAKHIAELLGLDISQVGITATTSDRLGAIGQGAGVAVSAQVLLYLDPQVSPA